MRNNIKPLILKVFLVILIFATLYMSYFFLIGIPKTQARNFYNKATIELENGDKSAAKRDLTKALSYWDESYIRNTLNSIN